MGCVSDSTLAQVMMSVLWNQAPLHGAPCSVVSLLEILSPTSFCPSAHSHSASKRNKYIFK